jgi:hypothetical protein
MQWSIRSGVNAYAASHYSQKRGYIIQAAVSQRILDKCFGKLQRAGNKSDCILPESVSWHTLMGPFLFMFYEKLRVKESFCVEP